MPAAAASTAELVQALGTEIDTLPALLWQRAALTPSATALWSLSAQQHWQALSWQAYRDQAARIAAALSEQGLQPGERVGLMAPSSVAWDSAQMGILAAAGVVVGLDPHDRDDALNAIAQQCNLAGLVVSDEGQLGRFHAEIQDRLHFVLFIGSAPQRPRPQDLSLDEILGRPLPAAEGWPRARPDDPATIIFTSGTTGTPKGIQYRHRQFITAVSAIIDALPEIDRHYRLACWLPLSNLFQRMINVCAIAAGAQTYYVENPRDIMRHIGSIAPHIFIGVPRFYEKLYAGITDKLSQAAPWQRRLVHWALEQGDAYATRLRDHQPPTLAISIKQRLADRLVLQRLRAIMGANLLFMVSGSAPMPRRLLEQFHAMGLLVLEAYGLSENIVPIAMNRPDRYRFGSVGLPLKTNQLRVADDGELLVSGPGVFEGYDQANAATDHRDEQGTLSTGDYASIDADGFVTLQGRKSEIFKTSTGRKIAPAGIEAVLRQLPDVEQAAVFGASERFLVAILAIEPTAWGLALTAEKQEDQTPLIGRCPALSEALGHCLQALPTYQRPAGVIVLSRAFSIERGELTTNLKLRRQEVGNAFAEPLRRLYQLLSEPQPEPILLAHGEDSLLMCPLKG